MNYRDLTTNDNRASLRRIARHEVPEFSNASILKSMETFVRTVNEMEETILVPSRLLDLAVGDAADTVFVKSKQQHGAGSIKEVLGNTDLYRLYNIVNQMKVELLWSKESSSANTEGDDHETGNRLTKPGHVRCPSTTSMQSVQSASSIASSSDTESDAGIENDSGLESEDSAERRANQAAENFRRHLRGLHQSIKCMTEAAEYLTSDTKLTLADKSDRGRLCLNLLSFNGFTRPCTYRYTYNNTRVMDHFT